MEAKLIKRGENNYKLYVNEVTFATTDNSPYKRLSLKNCQAIERGYDLDELAEKHINHEPHTTYILQRKFDFIEGFQKALGILGDKKFSKSDLENSLVLLISEMSCTDGVLLEKTPAEATIWINKHIQSLQKTEWDVEIKTQKYLQDVPYPNGEMPMPGIPILDSEGCLILQKIN